MRLAFHDCLKYSDDLSSNEINGCDGCLNPTGMNIDLMEKYEESRNAPNNLTLFTNNNGLTVTADILEEVFTSAGTGYPSLKARLDLSPFFKLFLGLKLEIRNQA